MSTATPDVGLDPGMVEALQPPCEAQWIAPGQAHTSRCDAPAAWVMTWVIECGTAATMLLCGRCKERRLDAARVGGILCRDCGRHNLTARITRLEPL